MIPTYFKNSVVVATITLTESWCWGVGDLSFIKMQFGGRRTGAQLLHAGHHDSHFCIPGPNVRGTYNRLGLRLYILVPDITQVGFCHTHGHVYLTMWLLDQIPDALIEAAYGQRKFPSVYSCKIIVPLLHNAIATIAIFEFVFVWNEFTFINTFIGTSTNENSPEQD